jgi:hypothetical protein
MKEIISYSQIGCFLARAVAKPNHNLMYVSTPDPQIGTTTCFVITRNKLVLHCFLLFALSLAGNSYSLTIFSIFDHSV